MQTRPEGETASMGRMLTRTFAKEGVVGLFRGVSAPLLVVTPLAATSFWSYDIGQRLIRKWYNVSELTTGQQCLAGALSAFPTSVLVIPSERIKVRMQVEKSTGNGGSSKKTMVSCATQLVRREGFATLYTGTILTLAREVPSSAAYFGTYEYSKKLLLKLYGRKEDSMEADLPPSVVMTAGGLAGVAYAAVGLPADVLKSRQQAKSSHTSVREVLRELVRNEGLGALGKGLWPALIRAVPANAACFLGMETTRKYLSFLDQY